LNYREWKKVPKFCDSRRYFNANSTLCFLFLLSSNSACFSQTAKIEKSPYKTTEEMRTKNKIDGLQVSVKAPSNFPLPVYASNIISTNFSNTTKGAPMADLTLLTKDDTKTVFEWYKTQCSNTGWQVRTAKQSAMSAKDKAGRLFILNAIKGEQQGTITVSSNGKHPETVINILWIKHA